MPPEPQPWERRELAGYAGRKHNRPPGGDALGGGGAAAAAPPGRWRDSPYRSPRSNFARSSPRRPPPGQFRQGTGHYQVPPEESGVGRVCTPSRSPPARFAGGRSGGGGRDGRGPGLYRRGTPSEPGGSWRRNQDLSPPVTAPRSLAVPVATVSYPYSSSQLPVVDELLGSAESNPKTFQWPRPCSMSLPKLSVTGLDEVGVEASVTDRKETPIGSPLTSPLVSDDGAAPRKKARLSWGQGLAKREKKTVEGSFDTVGQSAVVQGDSSTQAAVDDTGTTLASLGDCASLATLGSAISEASSAVQEQKPSIKDSNNDDASHPIDASGQGLQDCVEEFAIKLDPLDPTVLGNLTSLLADLLQHEDACLADSSFMRHTAMRKVLVLKKDISKELEKTECEIDLLENELKVLHGNGNIHPCESSSLQGTCSLERCLESADVTLNMLLDSTQLKDTVLASSLPLAGELLLHKKFSENDAETPDISDVCDGRVVLKCVKPTSVDDFEPLRLSGCTVDGGGSLIVDGCSICLDAGSSIACDDHDASPKVKDDNLVDAIIASNRVAARESSQVFAKFMSTYHPLYDTREPDYILSCRKNVEHVREKLAVRKRQFIFKEKVLSLKFRAFHHLWKEDMRLVSIRKNKPKAQRHLEPCIRASQKHRTSIRSRFILPAGNLTLVPTSEIVSFTSKLLSDSQIKLYRKNLKMPALILDDMEKKYSRFISSNGLVEDPSLIEKERATVNPWTQEEKNIFMEMLGTHGKDFTKISSFLAYKTTADCIEFYYKNHKSEHFRYVKKRLDLKKQPQFLCSNPCLITSQNKWNREDNAVSPDILGEASVAAANSTGKIRNQRKYARRSVSGSYHDFKVMRGNIHSLDRESAVDNSSLEKEIAAADVLAGICGSLSSEAVNSCVTSAVHPADKMDDFIMDTPFTSEVAKNIDEETCSDDDFGEVERVDWTDHEKSLLIRALIMYGKDFARISHFVGTRSMEQCKIFFSKARKCLGLDLVHRGAGIADTLMIDMNEEQSDTDGATAQELDSAVCSTQSCSKLDFDVTQSVGNTCSEGLVPGGSIPVHSETVATCEPCEEAGHDTGSVRVSPTFTASAEDVPLKSNAGVELQEDMPGVSPFDSSKSEVRSQLFMMPGSASVSGQQIKEDKDCNKSGYDSSSETGLMVSHSLAFVPDSQHQIPLEILSYLQRMPHIHPREVNSTNLPLNKVLSDHSSVIHEDLKHVASQSVLNFKEQGNLRQQNFVAKDIYHLCLMGSLLLNQVRQPLHVLRGYPLQAFNHKETTRNVDCVSEMPMMLESILKENGFPQTNQLFCPAKINEKNSGSQLLSLQSGVRNPLQGENKLEAHLQAHSESLCVETEAHSNRTSDFKLFGQILTHPSFQQFANPSSQDCDSQALSPKHNGSLTVKQMMDFNDVMTTSRLGSSDNLVKTRTGNRISLPESSLMLTEYQSTASSLYPEIGSGHNLKSVLTDYQHAYLQNLAEDGKALNNYSEPQKRNIFETVSGFQHPGRAMVGVNLGGGILVGAAGGLSNHAALKMHYTGRAKILKNEVDSWNGNVESK